MSRHLGRVIAFQALFAWEVTRDESALVGFPWLMESEEDAFYSSFSRLTGEALSECLSFASLLFTGALKNVSSSDEVIEKHLKSGWSLSRIDRVALAILRLSVYCLFHQVDVDEAVVINEAVEIAKDYSAQSTHKFVNAILDNISKSSKAGKREVAN